MASRKDEHKDETKAKPEHNDKLSTPPERKRAAEEQAALVPSAASIQHQQRQEIREAIVSAFDEAKENTQKAVKEAKRDSFRKKRPQNRNCMTLPMPKSLKAS